MALGMGRGVVALMRTLVRLLILVVVAAAWSGRNLPDQVSLGPNADLYRGPEHCDWQGTWFITIESEEIAGDSVGFPSMGPGWSMFVRDPESVERFVFDAPRDLDRPLPADARLVGDSDTGFELWFSDSDPDYVFLTDGDRTESWVRADEWFLCA